ncbi:hypothetical protein MMC26_001338 [Xylographa opegraphella]|nr:hypothetical protein [Xylographa opegraphella]
MPFTFTAAHSSRITKPRAKKISLKRAASTPFPKLNQRKPIQRSASKPELLEVDADDLFHDHLDDVGLVACLATDLSLRDVVPVMKYIRSHMFDDIPERSGMNSTRTAEVLNFRRLLPPIVTNAHVHALIKSPTLVEREIGELTSAGLVRKIVVPGRGVGRSSISDALVLVEDWDQLVRTAAVLGTDLIDKYVQQLRTASLSPTVTRGVFDATEVSQLMRAGFLSAPSQALNSPNVFSRPMDGSSGTLTSIVSIARANSASLAASSSQGPGREARNSGSASSGASRPQEPHFPTIPSAGSTRNVGDLQLALPSTGAFLKLLHEARTHLLSILGKSKFREAPLYLLRERWDGGVETAEQAARSSNYGRSFAGVLPGRTRKWKHFYGLRFDWVLEECAGAGLVEVFETGSVGRGVRAL